MNAKSHQSPPPPVPPLPPLPPLPTLAQSDADSIDIVLPMVTVVLTEWSAVDVITSLSDG